MLYVAIGFLFISIGAVIEGVLFDILGFSIFMAGTIQYIIVDIGVLIVLYSLYGRMTRPADGGNGS